MGSSHFPGLQGQAIGTTTARFLAAKTAHVLLALHPLACWFHTLTSPCRQESHSPSRQDGAASRMDGRKQIFVVQVELVQKHDSFPPNSRIDSRGAMSQFPFCSRSTGRDRRETDHYFLPFYSSTFLPHRVFSPARLFLADRPGLHAICPSIQPREGAGVIHFGMSFTSPVLRHRIQS